MQNLRACARPMESASAFSQGSMYLRNTTLDKMYPLKFEKQCTHSLNSLAEADILIMLVIEKQSLNAL